MKLLFRKDDDAEIHVVNVINEEEKDFSYVAMVKALLETREMEEPVIEDGFSDAEVASINSMVTHINAQLSGAVSEEEESEENSGDEDQ